MIKPRERNPERALPIGRDGFKAGKQMVIGSSEEGYFVLFDFVSDNILKTVGCEVLNGPVEY